jgi:hypothetical protein
MDDFSSVGSLENQAPFNSPFPLFFFFSKTLTLILLSKAHPKTLNLPFLAEPLFMFSL